MVGLASTIENVLVNSCRGLAHENDSYVYFDCGFMFRPYGYAGGLGLGQSNGCALGSLSGFPSPLLTGSRMLSGSGTFPGT